MMGSLVKVPPTWKTPLPARRTTMRLARWYTLPVLVAACVMPKGGAARAAPVDRTWAVPTLELYQTWWAKTEKCSGIRGDMSQVAFYAVDSPTGTVSLGSEVAHGWWMRKGNRIYLPANALGAEWLVRHEMLHALLQRGSHPSDKFVEACHLASLTTWRDSSLTVDPLNPEGR
jgi:hypothetical protein